MAHIRLIGLFFGLFLLGVAPIASAIDPADVPPPEQVYRMSASVSAPGRILMDWDIQDGYYLYRNKFKFKPQTEGLSFEQAQLPPGAKKHDEFFGEMEIYRGRVQIVLPYQTTSVTAEPTTFEVTYQGCADVGLCYPPTKQTVQLTLPPAVPSAELPKADPLSKLTGTPQPLSQAPGPDLLPPEHAFHFNAMATDARTVRVEWHIAPGYYLYRDRIAFDLLGPDGVRLDALTLPRGETKIEDHGPVEVFQRAVAVDLPLIFSGPVPASVKLHAKYQGCAEKGVCYPVMQQTVDLELPPTASTAAAIAPAAKTEVPAAQEIPEQDRIANALQADSLFATVATFFGFGLLMAFGPCVFPMIPILSGIIVGQGDKITAWRALLLSFVYVTAGSLTYSVFGILAGLFGGNLQATFQEPWVLWSFGAVFVLLSLSMFGFYELQMPAALQDRIDAMSRRQKGGTLIGVAIMGGLSALIVGPCMAAPLAGALIYIGKTGDALLGGLALFAMGMGMGVPLLLIGVSAGKLLPKAGIWMNTVKSVFGVIMLGVAVWLLQRVIPAQFAMLLWALLLIIPAVYLSALDPLPVQVSGWRKLWKGLGVSMFAYGLLMLVGLATGSDDPLQPLRGLTVASSQAPAGGQPAASSAFVDVRHVDDLNARLAQAKAQGRWVVVDYYADWCISCKEMERYTFGNDKVKAALSQAVLIRADVTDNDSGALSLLKQYGLVGPPAILFFGPDGTERRQFRLIGDLPAEPFLAHLNKVLGT